MAHQGNDIAKDETERLIASSKVEGTTVYGRSGEKLGTIHNFMVEKRSGRVEYAVLNTGGGLLGSARFYPLPWDVLTYDPERGGYAVDLDPGQLEGAPSYQGTDEPRYDTAYGEQIRGHYRR